MCRSHHNCRIRSARFGGVFHPLTAAAFASWVRLNHAVLPDLFFPCCFFTAISRVSWTFCFSGSVVEELRFVPVPLCGPDLTRSPGSLCRARRARRSSLAASCAASCPLPWFRPGLEAVVSGLLITTSKVSWPRDARL